MRRPPSSKTTTADVQETLTKQLKQRTLVSRWRHHLRSWLIVAAVATAVAYTLDTFGGPYDNIGNIDTSGVEYAAYGPIDAVYTWVNGSDPKWQQSKSHWLQRWSGRNATKDSASAENRFRDNDELRYSIRSLETYAPWIRRIFLVTDGQVPTWLDLSHPRITVVPHSDIFPNASHLPSFASPAIESHLDNIPGLAEYFLYFNDEVFLSAPVLPSDFMSPRGTQNLFFAWDAPDCAPGCKHAMLGNDQCHASCNVASCDYDLGDCTCDASMLLVEQDDWDTVCRAPDRSMAQKTSECRLGCLWDELGDGVCNSKCNLAECGFDFGDCDERALSMLPKVSVGESSIFALDGSTIVLNTSQLGTKVSATAANSGLAPRRLQSIDGHDVVVARTVLMLTNTVSNASWTVVVVPNARHLHRGFWYIDGAPDAWSAASVVTHWQEPFQLEPSQLDVRVYAPARNASSAVYAETVVNGVLTRIRCGDTNLTAACSWSGSNLSVSTLASTVRLCLDEVSCLVVVSANTSVHVATPPHLELVLPTTVRDCGRYLSCTALFESLDESCVNDIAYLGRRAKTALVTLCTRDASDEAGATMLKKMCRVGAGTEMLPSRIAGCLAPEELGDDATAPDMFGDSLRFVDRLLTKTFGHPVHPRGVPSHMPHFVQKRLWTEAKQLWPVEFDLTSSHRFRLPTDMQFSFTYMHYVANRHRPLTLPEVFDSLIDINHNGVVDEYEVENIQALVPKQLTTCSTDAPWTQAFLMANCLDLVTALTTAPILPPATFRVRTPPVLFVMLNSQASAIDVKYQLHLTTQKFVCINDDISWPAPEVSFVLQWFLRQHWPHPSTFELLYGATHSYSTLSAYYEEVKAQTAPRPSRVYTPHISYWHYTPWLLPWVSSVLYSRLRGSSRRRVQPQEGAPTALTFIV